jgi:hypothetical protein
MGALGLRGRGLASPGEVVTRLVALQAQEHPYARWSVAQRTRGAVTGPAIDRAFDQGAFLRTHVLRPTWHYVAPTDLRWLLGLSGPRIDAGNARRYEELELDAATLARADDVIAAAVAGGSLTRREVAAILERRRISVAGQRLSYLLMHAELHRVICSGPMKATQHTYAAFDARVPRGGAAPEGDEALAELARRYVSTRGPVTLDDFVWWSGLRTGEARRAFDAVTPEFDTRVVGDRRFWFVDRRAGTGGPRVDLVQCYDEVVISYRQSRDVLHTPSSSFPVPRHLGGFVHVVLLDGRLLGHWRAVRRGRHVDVETRLDATLGRDERRALADAVDRYVQFARP